MFDDSVVVVGNPFISGRLDNLGEVFTNPYFAYRPEPGLYRPLTITSYALNAFIFGFSPVSFHVVNILLHALTSYLIFVLIYRLACLDTNSREGSKITALAGFLFFMFLPIHVENITSIVGRAEILSLLFTVAALIFLLEKKYILASGLFFLGLLSKEMAVSFLPMFLLLEVFVHKNKARDILRNSIFFVLIVALYGALRYLALGEYFLKNDATMVHNPILFSSFFTGIWTSFKVVFLYFEKIFFPVSLSIDYSFNQIPLVENLFLSWEALLGIIIFGGSLFMLFRSENSLFKVGILMFWASYFVISNWVFKTGTIMAERLMYTPSLGLALLVGLSYSYLYSRIENKKLLFSLAVIPLIFYGFTIIDRNKDWLNEQDLYQSAYEATPNSIVNQTNKAYLDYIEKNYELTEKRLDKVLSSAPEHLPAIVLAGQNYKKLGRIDKAEEYWKKAIKLNSNYLRAYLSIGVLYYENGYFESAEKVLEDAVNIYPRSEEILFLSLSKTSLGKADEAVVLIEDNFGKNPLRKDLKFALGWAYLNKGDRDIAYGYFADIKNPNMSMEEYIKTFEGSKIILLGDF